MSDDDYDAAADLTASIEFCYRAIRERMARGGPPWVPPTINETPGGKAGNGAVTCNRHRGRPT